MEPLNLTARPPRSPFDELDGLIFLPRTIDKLRAFLPGGDPGEFIITGEMYGMSQYMLDSLGVSEADLRDAVSAARNDADVAAWLREHADASKYAELSATIRRIKPKHVPNERAFREDYAETLTANPELQTILEIIEADDRRKFGASVAPTEADRPVGEAL